MRSITAIFFILLFAINAAAKSKVSVVVDERMELLTIIQYLSGYPVLTQADLKYKKEIDDYFRDFRDHPAVMLNRNIYERFFGFDAPPTYLYHFSFPGFKQIADFSENDLRAFEFDKHADTFSLLLSHFKDFYKRADFHRFYTTHKGFYDSLTGPVQGKIGESNVIEIMEEHYGKTNKEYNVVLVPLLHDGGYGPMVHKGNSNILYAVIGPMYTSKEFPEFDVKNILSEYVIHEFSHSFCNPLIAENLKELAKDSCLLKPIIESQREQGYGSWEGCLYEHFVRANEILLTEKILGRQKGGDLMDDMYRNGQWIYLRGLVDVMRRYEGDRKKYKTIDAIMPEVVAYFHEESVKCN